MRCPTCKKIVTFLSVPEIYGISEKKNEETNASVRQEVVGNKVEGIGVVYVITCPHCETILGIVPNGVLYRH